MHLFTVFHSYQRMALFRLLQTEYLEKGIDEFKLLEDGKNQLPSLRFEDLTHEILRESVKEKGIGLTTSLLYNKLLYKSQSSDFIKKIDSTQPDLTNLPKLSGKLLIAPSGFYKELPEYAGDGSLVIEIANQFGLDSEIIPLNTKGSITENANIIREYLKKETSDKIIIFSLSKGGSDLLLALEQESELQKKILVWVSFCGIFKGTLLSDQFLSRRGIKKWLQDGIFRSLGIAREFLPEFSYTKGVLAKEVTLRLPNAISVIGVPIESHLRGNLLRRFKTLSPNGPNDGISLHLDSILPESKIYPVWGADHYFRFSGISKLIYKILYSISELER